VLEVAFIVATVPLAFFVTISILTTSGKTKAAATAACVIVLFHVKKRGFNTGSKLDGSGTECVKLLWDPHALPEVSVTPPLELEK
jgi:hypothetical protein